MNSTRFTVSTVPQKAGGQVTVAATVTAIMTNYCSSQEEKIFTQVKARFFRDFRGIRGSSSAYIRELIPQSSAGSKLLPQQQKSFREALFQALAFSRNTLPQPSFRNSILNTVLYCKPQLAIYFYFTFRIIWFQSPVAWFSVYVTYPPFGIRAKLCNWPAHSWSTVGPQL